MLPHLQVLAILQSLGWPELMVLGLLGLLLFGKRLPEVGRSLAQSFVQFKKGLKETGDDLRTVGQDADEEVRDIRETPRGSKTRVEQKTSSQAKSLDEP